MSGKHFPGPDFPLWKWEKLTYFIYFVQFEGQHFPLSNFIKKGKVNLLSYLTLSSTYFVIEISLGSVISISYYALFSGFKYFQVCSQSALKVFQRIFMLHDTHRRYSIRRKVCFLNLVAWRICFEIHKHGGDLVLVIWWCLGPH